MVVKAILKTGMNVPSGWKSVCLKWQNSQAKFFCCNRVFLFQDWTVVKIQRSKNLAVQSRNRNILSRLGKSLRVLILKMQPLSSLLDTFFMLLKHHDPTRQSQLILGSWWKLCSKMIKVQWRQKVKKYLGRCQLSDVAWSNFSTDSHMSTYGISNELLFVFKLRLKCS